MRVGVAVAGCLTIEPTGRAGNRRAATGVDLQLLLDPGHGRSVSGGLGSSIGGYLTGRGRLGQLAARRAHASWRGPGWR